MTEYWKSTPKYWCKHCQTFVADSPLSRKNHDATAKHQIALKKFLRELHKTNEREKRDSESAKREVERLNNLVGGVGSSSSSSTAVPTPSVAKPEQSKAKAWGKSNRLLTATEQKRQMKELEALGVAMPEEFRGDLAMPGEWKTVPVEESSVGKEMTEEERAKAELSAKLKREEDEAKKWKEMDEDERAMKGFKIQTRTYPGQDNGEEVDVSALFKKRKKSPELKKETETGVKTEDGIPVKTEPDESPPGVSVKQEDKQEEQAATTPGVVFKKRKVKSIRQK